MGIPSADCRTQDKMRIRALDPSYMTVEHTIQILYRLGFLWPETGSEYVRRFIAELDRLGFFSD